MSICLYCQNYFHARRPHQIYCRATCRDAHYHLTNGKGPMHTCQHCSREFAAKHPNQKFCSKHCGNMHAYHHKSKTAMEAACPQCKRAFIKIRPHHYFCSAKCRIAAYIDRRDSQRLQRVSGAREEAPAEFIARMQGKHDEIMASRLEVQRWPSGPGVYFLILKERVVYVGQSVSLSSRLAGHIAALSKGVKDFDSFSWIECDARDLNFMERTFQVIYDSTIAYSCNGKPSETLRGQRENALRLQPGQTAEIVGP